MTIRSQSGVPGGRGVPGGQVGMVDLAAALARLGVEVDVFVGGPRMHYLERIEGVTTTYLRWPLTLDRWLARSPSPLRRIGGIVRRRRWLAAVASLPALRTADVLHVQGLEDAEALLDRVRGPLVVTHWGRVGRWLPGGARRRGRTLPERIDRIRSQVRLVALGDAQADALAAAGLPVTAVIPPGFDLRRFTPGDRGDARRDLGLPVDDRIVLYVGRLSKDKDVATLLRAFAGLVPRPDTRRLLVVGDGPLRVDLERLAAELGITGSTTFVSFVARTELPVYYRAADVLVVPSDLLETFCMVAFEAIACGCPVIVTDQVPEIVRRFPTVPSFASYDVHTLTQLLDEAVDGRIQAADPGQVAGCDWIDVARRYVDLYETGLGRAG